MHSGGFATHVQLRFYRWLYIMGILLIKFQQLERLLLLIRLTSKPWNIALLNSLLSHTFLENYTTNEGIHIWPFHYKWVGCTVNILN